MTQNQAVWYLTPLDFAHVWSKYLYWWETKRSQSSTRSVTYFSSYGPFKFTLKSAQNAKFAVKYTWNGITLTWSRIGRPTLYNVCAVPWGVFITVGGYHEYRGGYLEYRGGCSVPWGYHDKCGGISWVPWGCSVPWGDIMSTVGGYLEYRGDVQYCGGYHDARRGISWCTSGDIMSTVEGVQYRGGKVFCYLSTPQYWTPPTVLMISPHMHHDIPPRYSKFKGWYPPTVLNTPHGTHDIPPRASWYPTVLNIPHGTQDNPHGTHDIPPRYSRYPPHLSWYPPTVLNTPRYSRYPPTVLMISPHGTEHSPRYWAPPTVLHTHYTGWDHFNFEQLYGWNEFRNYLKASDAMPQLGHGWL